MPLLDVSKIQDRLQSSLDMTPSCEKFGTSIFLPKEYIKSIEEKKMITASIETHSVQVQSNVKAREYAERLVLSLGYNDAICTAMEFQWFNVAEELRFMQDDYRGV